MVNPRNSIAIIGNIVASVFFCVNAASAEFKTKNNGNEKKNKFSFCISLVIS